MGRGSGGVCSEENFSFTEKINKNNSVWMMTRVFPNFGTFPENFDIRKQIFSLKKR